MDWFYSGFWTGITLALTGSKERPFLADFSRSYPIEPNE
jgi:hypothetical protein